MLDRLEPSLDIKVAGAIDAAGFRIGILNGGDSDMRRRRQIACPILRAQVVAALFPPSSAGTFGTDTLGARHRENRLPL